MCSYGHLESLETLTDVGSGWRDYGIAGKTEKIAVLGGRPQSERSLIFRKCKVLLINTANNIP